MASGVLSETILIIASVIAAAALAVTVMGQMSVFESAFSASTENQKEITLTKIKVIYVTNSTSSMATAWVKNIGMKPIDQPNSVDVYFGKLGSVQRIPYNTGIVPTWNYSSPTILWQTKDTAQINIYYDTDFLKNAPYVIKVITPNGISDDSIFSTS